MTDLPPAGAEPAPIASAATAQALELPALLASVAALAATDAGRDRLVALAPAGEPAELAGRRRRYEEVSRLLAERRLVPSFETPPGELLLRLATGRPAVGGAELVGFAGVVRATAEAAQRIRNADPACPELAAFAADLPDLSELERAIGARLDRRGEVREDASPELAALRRRIRGARDQIYRELGDFLGAHREHFAEETVPMRGGRLVLMLPGGSKGQVAGLVHGRSGSGRSLYFEPFAVVESNNNLQQAVEDEEAERARILAELLRAVRERLPDVERQIAFLAELDLHQAARRWADAANAHLPDESPRNELSLAAARHPLLDPALAELRREALGQSGHTGAIVPLDVTFHPGRRALVVTGPNAGGKTVALKTVGLLALAAQCGLPIPAALGSAVPFFRRIVATVGDEQDLMADRSTFSGRLLRLDEAWRGAGPDSLLLLDELGSGTDPEEGAALSVALLEGIVARGGLAVVTTHLTQLAAAALDLPGAACAAMAFDPATGRPVYRLLPGPPGGSEALALARRLGLPAEWLDRAEQLLGSEHRRLQHLLAEVERVREELAGERGRAERAAAEAEELRDETARERDLLAEERRTLGKRLRAELDAFRRSTTEKLREETERLREAFAAGRRKGLEAEATERLFAAAPDLEGPEPPPAGGPLAVGARVRHLALGWEGVLEKLERDRAEVAVHGKRVRCRVAELAPRAPAAPAPRRAGFGWKAASAPAADAEAPEAPPELNLIGQRVEPALVTIDAYLDQALLSGRTAVRIVHGHGTGKLRQAVREHLRRHAAVSAFRSGERNEGGDGATVVTLKG